MEIQEAFKNNLEWVKEKEAKDPNYFKNLSTGQSPSTLYFGCADSRVTIEELIGAEPGDLFVHRNVANLVIGTDLNAMSVLDYAITYLNVKNVVVCGHYYCGGVKAAMIAQDMGILNGWLRNIRDVYRIHRDELNSISDEDKKYRRLIELNVQEQCVNLLKTALVQKAIIKYGLTVHGWVFDVHTGKLIDLKIDTDHILKGIREIYDLTSESENL